jgi:hypothetical protein
VPKRFEDGGHHSEVSPCRGSTGLFHADFRMSFHIDREIDRGGFRIISSNPEVDCTAIEVMNHVDVDRSVPHMDHGIIWMVEIRGVFDLPRHGGTYFFEQMLLGNGFETQDIDLEPRGVVSMMGSPYLWDLRSEPSQERLPVARGVGVIACTRRPLGSGT